MRHRTTFDIVGPDGGRVTIRPASADDTVGDLAVALGRPAGPLRIDGRPVAAGRRLTDVPGLRAGSLVEAAVRPSERPAAPASHDAPARIDAPATSDASIERHIVEMAVVAGPDCRGWRGLGTGRHTIGTSPHCTVRLCDPAAELHHGVLDVDSSGDVRFTQLTGRVPVRIDGRPADGRSEVPSGATVEIGRSVLRFRPVTDAGTSAGSGGSTGAPGPDPIGGPPSAAGGCIVAGADPWRRVVRRPPPAGDRWEWPALAAPPPPDDHRRPPATALVGAAVAVLGALVMASVLGQMLFALFSLIGATAALATWIVGAAAAARRGRVARRTHADRLADFGRTVESALDAWRAHHRRRAPTIVETIAPSDDVDGWARRVWTERPGDDGALDAIAGVGVPSPEPPVEGWSTLPDEIHGAVHRLLADELLPVPVRLSPGDGLAVHGEGPMATAVVRASILHLAVRYGPADWQLLVVTRDVGRWAWAGWLPHAVAPDGTIAVIPSSDIDAVAAALVDDRTTVVVTDDPALFDARTGPARRLVASRRAIVVGAVDREHSIPGIFSRVLRIGSTGWAEWVGGDPPAAFPGAVRITGVGADVASATARRLAAFSDPEDVEATASALPATLGFAEIDRTGDDAIGGLDADVDAADGPVEGIVQRWRVGGVDPPPSAPIGVSADGIVDVDLVRDGPHGLIAGTTGSGKSELLRTLVLALATRCSPDQLCFVLVDYKGGSTFDACARLPHVVGVVTDLDAGGAARSLVSLDAELRRRERLLREVGAAELSEYRRRPGSEPLPRLVVVVDEFAALVQELPDFVASLVGVAQRGRSLGVHLLLATQRPSGVVSDDIRANTNLRLALRLNDGADARDVVGDVLPATISRRLAGRAVLRLGPDDLVVFQTARCMGPAAGTARRLTATIREQGPAVVADGDREPDGPTELSATVDAVCAAAQRLAIGRPHRPWTDPLPAMLTVGAVDDVVDATADSAGPTGRSMRGRHDAVGVVDDPEHQTRCPLRWDPALGNLVLAGALGSGRTSALVGVVVARCRIAPADRLHVYVLDAVGDPLLDALGEVAHVGAVIRARDTERLHRLLVRLDDEIGRRQEAPSDVQILLVVDGYDSLRDTLSSSIDRIDTSMLLDRVVADGAGVGVVAALTVGEDGRADGGERWRFGGADRPGRITVASSGLEAQIVAGAPGLAELPGRTVGRGPPAIDVLPDRIERTTLARSWSSSSAGATAAHLVVGRDAARLDDAALTVPAGDHVFVGGAARAGKTTALGLLTDAWRDAHPDGEVVEVGRHTALEWTARGVPALLVVDDADRVDDPVLARLAATSTPGVTLLVAARTEAVRARYGHWTRDVARSRCGIVLTSSGDVDGELLGVNLPSRTLIAPRPGLGWLVDPHGARLVQLATVSGCRRRPARESVYTAGSSPSR